MERYEENKNVSPFWGWVMVFLLTGVIIGWCMFLMMMVEDPPRQWDFGTLPDAPGESIYSTLKAPPVGWVFPFRLRTPPYVTQDVPRQVPALPEGIPWKRPATQTPVQQSQPGGAP